MQIERKLANARSWEVVKHSCGKPLEFNSRRQVYNYIRNRKSEGYDYRIKLQNV
jgi:hypothetical protein